MSSVRRLASGHAAADAPHALAALVDMLPGVRDVSGARGRAALPHDCGFHDDEHKRLGAELERELPGTSLSTALRLNAWRVQDAPIVTFE